MPSCLDVWGIADRATSKLQGIVWIQKYLSYKKPIYNPFADRAWGTRHFVWNETRPRKFNQSLGGSNPSLSSGCSYEWGAPGIVCLWHRTNIVICHTNVPKEVSLVPNGSPGTSKHTVLLSSARLPYRSVIKLLMSKETSLFRMFGSHRNLENAYIYFPDGKSHSLRGNIDQ
jgi:hypothetical protein